MATETVYSLKDAEEWFLSHSSGSVECVKDGASAVVETYPEAKAFFEAN